MLVLDPAAAPDPFGFTSKAGPAPGREGKLALQITINPGHDACPSCCRHVATLG